jgi:hypothetical protein
MANPRGSLCWNGGSVKGIHCPHFCFFLVAEGLSVMMRDVVKSNLFTGYTVGSGAPTVVSHLQFTNDILLMGVKIWANVRAQRAVLVIFEAMSDLKVNFLITHIL